MAQAPSYFDASKNDDIVDHTRCVPASAMTLRDYFAAKIVQAHVLAAMQTTRCDEDAVMNLSRNYRLYADEAYVLADEMIEARDVP